MFTQQGVSKNKVLRKSHDYQGIGLIIVLIVFTIIFGILSPHFFTLRNLYTLLLSVVVIGIASIGETLVLLTGELDLSIESTIVLVGVTMALLNLQGLPFSIIIIISFLIGPVIGMINGVLVTKMKINSVILTLSTMFIIRGVAALITGARTIPLYNKYVNFISNGKIFWNLPFSSFCLLMLFVIFYFILNYTTFGRNVYYVGGNATAAHLAGVNVDKYKIIVFAASGAMGAISGIFFAAITGSGIPFGASGYILTIIAAVILGGTKLSGGKGKIEGTFLGILILGILSNGLIMVNVQRYWQMVITGAVLIISVGIDSFRKGNGTSVS